MARYLVPVLFGEAYAEVSSMIALLLGGIAPFGVIMIVSAYFSGTGRVWINFVSAIIGFFVGVIFDVLWIPDYGIWGAASASIASYWSTALFVLLVFFSEKKTTRSAISEE
jgi:O-antigen/teichoic acid export membrane protein